MFSVKWKHKLKIEWNKQMYKMLNLKKSTSSGGSLGSWVDEERSKLRADV
jgi:hypothetical protein